MNTKSISLDHVQVAKPCPASWEEMKGNDLVRFCSQCQLNVYNLSALTKLEAESLVTRSEGRLCVKFYRRADGTILTQDCPVGVRAFRKRVSKIAATAFSTLLSLLTGSSIGRFTFAQDFKLDQSKPTIKRTDSPFTASSIEGSVADVTQAVIVGAQITLINQQTKRETTTKSSTIGKFKFQNIEAGSYTIKIFSQGFKTFAMSDIQVAANEALEIPLGLIALEVGATVGELIIVEDNIKTSDHVLPHQLNRKEKPREQ